MKRDRARTGSAPPDFLTVEEAVDVVRIGRTAAYAQARQYLATGGAPGLLPVVPFGKQFRVPRCKLEEFLGGPNTWPPVPYEPARANAVTQVTAPDPLQRPVRRRASRTEQTVLTFPA